jgi:hypothetical protein
VTKPLVALAGLDKTCSPNDCSVSVKDVSFLQHKRESSRGAARSVLVSAGGSG